MPQPSEHLFHSLVIAPSGKKKPIQTGQPVPQKTQWHNSAPQLHLQMTGATEGEEENMAQTDLLY